MSAIEKIEQNAAQNFVKIYKGVHKCSDEDAQNLFGVEVFNFRRLIEESKPLQECTEFSVMGTFLEVIANGLTFDKTNTHIYLMPRNVNVGTREAPKWEKRMTYSFAASGLMYLAKAAKSISACTVPTIVYDGDIIEVETVNGSQRIKHTPKIPRKSNKILGGFCILTLPSGNKEEFWFDIAEIERLVKFSAKQNKGTANELYTAGVDGQIDVGFLRTKIVKMALKGKPLKVDKSENLSLSEDGDTAFEAIPGHIEETYSLPEAGETDEYSF